MYPVYPLYEYRLLIITTLEGADALLHFINEAKEN